VGLTREGRELCWPLVVKYTRVRSSDLPIFIIRTSHLLKLGSEALHTLLQEGSS